MEEIYIPCLKSQYYRSFVRDQNIVSNLWDYSFSSSKRGLLFLVPNVSIFYPHCPHTVINVYRIGPYI